MKNPWGYIFMGLAIIATCVAVMFAIQANEQSNKNTNLVIQNVQLTNKTNEVKAEAYRAGIIACGNEDVLYLNGLADEYDGSLLGKLFERISKGWTYDDDTLNKMVESYMGEDTN